MIGRDKLDLYRFLGTLARSEDYPPKDGPYQDYRYFKPASLEKVRGFWKRTLALGDAPQDRILYLHWPFCPSQCRYCFCSMAVPRSVRQMLRYADRLKREMDAFSDLFEGREFGAVYIGGGTPTFMPDAALEGLLGHIRGGFKVRGDAEFYMEASPATLSDVKMRTLRRHGVNRVTLGVQSRDRAVLAAANRKGQDARVVEEAWGRLAASEGLVRDIDLMLGVDGQGRESFLKDLLWSIRSKPDVIHINSFDPRGQTLFSRGGGRVRASHWTGVEKSLAAAERLLGSSGYRVAEYDPERRERTRAERILSDDPFELGSILAVGLHAKGHAFGSAWYQHEPLTQQALDADRLPRFTYLPSSPAEEARAFAARSLCLHQRLNLAELRRLFGMGLEDLPDLRRRLSELEECERVEVGPEEVRLRMTHPVDRLIWLKHLCKEEVLGAMRKAHAREFRAFLKDGSAPARLAEKARSRTFHRVYYKT
jgi:coproporphyrinogen III oxidase-like Fe-S oxidoreductase